VHFYCILLTISHEAHNPSNLNDVIVIFVLRLCDEFEILVECITSQPNHHNNMAGPVVRLAGKPGSSSHNKKEKQAIRALMHRFTSPLLFLLLIISLSTLRYSSAFLPPAITGLHINHQHATSASRSSTLLHQLDMPSSASPNRLIQWKVRPATPEDEAALTELLTASYSTLLQDDYDSKILEEALPLISSPRPDLLTCGTWYVVESDSNQDSDGTMLVGCGGWTRENPSTRNTHGHSHLRHFATHPDFLRMGVGRALWDKVLEDVVKDTNENAIPTLEVYSTLTAQPFYESLGFRTVEPIYIPIPLTANCKFPSVIMRREVT
jgi:ribosomal protein S18 acetylase RimI-like enzyme